MAVRIGTERVIAAKPLLVDEAISVVKGIIDKGGRFKLHPGQLPGEILRAKGIDVAWRMTDEQHGTDYLAAFAADIHHVAIVRQIPPDASQTQLADLMGLSRRGSETGVEYFFNPSSGSSFVYQYGGENPFLQSVADGMRE